MLLPLLNRQDINIDGIILGVASAYTKFEFPRTEVSTIRAAISKIDSVSVNDVAAVSAQRKLLVNRLVELVDADPVPEPIRRLADALSVEIGKEEQGLRSIYQEIIEKDGPQAKLRDRSDRIVPDNWSEVLPLAK